MDSEYGTHQLLCHIYIYMAVFVMKSFLLGEFFFVFFFNVMFKFVEGSAQKVSNNRAVVVSKK